MKKRWFYGIMLAAMMLVLGACGNKTKETDGIDPDDYVTLGDYSNLTARVDVITVSDNDIDEEMKTELEYYISSYNLYEYQQITDRDDVQNGDMVNIDYEGKKDGVAFEGGTASGTYLEIGSGTFIPGFEEGLIGTHVGETVDLDLTFPENYQSEELAGQAVVFTVTVNGIYDASNRIEPAMDDALLKKMYDNIGTSFDNIADFRENVKSYLENQAAEKNEENKSNAIWEAVYATCEVKDPPQELVDRIKTRIYNNAQNYADQNLMELDDFLLQSLQMTREEFDEMTETSSIDSAKEVLAVYAIANKEGIVITQQGLAQMKEEEAKVAGKNVEDYFAGVSDQDYYDYALAKLVDDYLATIVKVEEK